jgi:hypothetical protein
MLGLLTQYQNPPYYVAEPAEEEKEIKKDNSDW